MKTLHLLVALCCSLELNAIALRAPSTFKVGTVTAFTEITFDAQLNCELEEVYCITGHFVEADVVTDNDNILPLPFYCTKGSISFTTMANYTGSDGISTDYDPALELFHNCSTSGKVHQLFKHFRVVDHDKWSAEYNFTIDLANNGISNPADFLEVPQYRSSKWPSFIVDFLFHGIPVQTYLMPNDFYNITQTD